MKKMCVLLATGILASSVSAQEAGDRLNLVCLGAGSANKQDRSTANIWNNYGDSASATIVGNRSQPFDDQVNLWIEGEEGQLRMPPVMLPLLRGGDGGWFKVKDIKMDRTEITGTVTVNFMNNPKLRIDRMSGGISLAGKAGNYSGRCQKYDPDAAEQQF